MTDYEEKYLMERVRTNSTLYKRLCEEGFAYSKAASLIKARIDRWQKRLVEIKNEKRDKTSSL